MRSRISSGRMLPSPFSAIWIRPHLTLDMSPPSGITDWIGLVSYRLFLRPMITGNTPFLAHGRPRSVHRARQDIPPVAPVVRVFPDIGGPAGAGRALRARRVHGLACTGHEIGKIIANQHDDAVVLGNQLAPNQFFTFPRGSLGRAGDNLGLVDDAQCP